MLRQSLIAAALALAAIAATPAPGSAAPLQNGADTQANAARSDTQASAVQPGTETNAVHQGSQANAVHHRVVVVHRTVVHHVYRYEPAPAPYYAAPYYGYYAPAPVTALPAAPACVALSLIGAC
jgi:hypothetical protein